MSSLLQKVAFWYSSQLHFIQLSCMILIFYPISTVVPIVTVVGYSRVVNAESAMSHPQRFISTSGDKEALELVRSEWKVRNHGIGLRDVRRSGGGV
ncbi:hypothetical protein INT43_001129 [Umbelopsis isabellina]|uniref:Uncharacterized protein n=1 Tax=Mortierella isabellina TaxID=91625 RepID=A0A8H7PK28_MORIS|nr:hypothetical protein INT43_001129 [Umbelopsis isabellina]